MQIFINVPQGSLEFTNLKPIEGDSSFLKLKKERQAKYQSKKTSILKIIFVVIFINDPRLIIVSL